eukprot:4516360-Pyramimonas_sp.AAC.1
MLRSRLGRFVILRNQRPDHLVPRRSGVNLEGAGDVRLGTRVDAPPRVLHGVRVHLPLVAELHRRWLRLSLGRPWAGSARLREGIFPQPCSSCPCPSRTPCPPRPRPQACPGTQQRASS